MKLDRLLAWLIFAVALSLFLALLTAHHSYDAVAGGVLLYQWIANGAAAQLFHPYHILYLPLGATLLALLDFLGLGPDPLTLLQTINAPFAAGALALFYALARRLGLERWLSVALVALFGTGSSYTYYASNAEPYAPSIFFLLLAFVSALALPAAAAPRRVARPGVWLGLAAGLHVTCLLALPALALAAWPGVNCEKPLRRPWIVAAAACAVVLAPYVFAYAHFDHTDPLTGFKADLAKTVDPGYRGRVWWSVDPENVFRQWRSLGEAQAPVEHEGARSSFPTGSRALALGLWALTLLPVALLLPQREKARGAGMLVVWFLATFVFFSAYNTASEKFASYQWAPLLLLAGLAVRSLKPLGRVHAAFGVLTLFLAAGTFLAGLDLSLQRADPRTNVHLARALALARHTEPDDLVVHLGRGANQYEKVYLPYFAVRRSLVLDRVFDKTRRGGQETLRLVGDRILEEQRLKHRVLLLADAAEQTRSRREFEEFHGLASGSLGQLFAAFRPRVAAEEPGLGRLWSLEPPPVVPASSRP